MKRTLLVILVGLLSLGCGTRAGLVKRADSSVPNVSVDAEVIGPTAVDAAEVAVAVEVAAEAAQEALATDGQDSGADRESVRDNPREAGPTDGAPADQSALDTSGPLDGGADACAAVANQTFIAVQMHECGILANGQIVGCYWTLVFRDDGVQRLVYWRHSDLLDTLVYQCDGWKLSASPKGISSPTYVGTYDPATGGLDWVSDGYVQTTLDAAAP